MYWLRILCYISLSALFFSCGNDSKNYYKISTEEFKDKMMGAWIGQMAGVGWGLPTEFHYTDKIIPEADVPEWKNEMINQQGNDDIYVEMTFLSSLEKYGLDVSSRQAGIDFANTGYTLWAANNTGRENLRFGIAPPESSHPEYSNNCDDIDYQIEADYSGIIAPGMPNVSIELGDKFGRLMNYGDGLYGGIFVGSMYAAAYFENDIEKIIEKALESIPQESHYAHCVRDVLNWYREDSLNWMNTWNKIEEKYHKSYDFQKFAKQKNAWIPIDAKMNGAYIVMGLLYGKGDMDSTIVISMRGGKDSDCNPSNAAGVLAATVGYKNLPNKFKSGLERDKKFSYSEYNFNDLVLLSENLAKQYLLRNGGKIEKNSDGKEFMLIPKMKAVPPVFQPSYEPGSYNPENRYSEEELGKIQAYSSLHLKPVFEELGINMVVRHCGKQINPEIISWNNKEGVVSTIPMSNKRSVELIYSEKINIPQNKKVYLSFFAGHEKNQKWKLKIRMGRDTVMEKEISSDNSKNGWEKIKIDVSEFSGKESVNVTFFAENIDKKPAINYWTGFKTVIE